MRPRGRQRKYRHEVGIYFVQKLYSGSHFGRWGGGSGAIVPVLHQRTRDIGKITRLLLHRLYPLELVQMFSGGCCIEEQEVGQNRVQELTREKP